jgi:hypothetical protein
VQRALQERSQADVAEAVGVSTKTLAEVTKGWHSDALSGRKRVGLAESLTRLALYFQVDPQAVLREVGIWDEPGVQAKSRATVEEEVVSTSGQGVAAEGDRALTDIQVRGRLENKSGIVKAGILAWKPFHLLGGADSFAHRYCRSVLKAVNPDWIVAIEEYRNLDDSLRALTGIYSGTRRGGGFAGGAPEVDMVFGLYDLVSREAQGLEFVPVPGLSVRAGAIWIGREVSWFDLLSPPSESYRPFAVVVRAEAGYLTLAGACDYPLKSLQVLDSIDPDDIVDALLHIVHDKWEKSRIPVCFVADSFSVEDVTVRLEHQLHQNVTYGLVQQGMHEWAPRYQLGVGVRADSERFKRLLLRATQINLFGSSIPHTARLYWDLLRPLQTDGRVQVLRNSLEQLGAWQLDRFKLALKASAPEAQALGFTSLPVWSDLFQTSNSE